jgi:hypothetical protein
MDSVTRFCLRIGLVSGAIALLSASIVLLYEFGIPVSATLRDSSEQCFQVFGLAFMWLGIVLLITAIDRLWRAWPYLSSAERLVSVLGLGAGMFIAAYIFHCVFPTAPKNQHD